VAKQKSGAPPGNAALLSMNGNLAEYVECQRQQNNSADERAKYAIGGFRCGSDDEHDFLSFCQR